jgi:hypothetical protein
VDSQENYRLAETSEILIKTYLFWLAGFKNISRAVQFTLAVYTEGGRRPALIHGKAGKQGAGRFASLHWSLH